jgi:protein-disulfide isomerase
MATSRNRKRPVHKQSTAQRSAAVTPKRAAADSHLAAHPPRSTSRQSLGTPRGPQRHGRARYAAAVRRVRRRWISLGAIAAVLAVVFVGYLLRPHAAVPPLSAARLALDPSLGPADAPITLIEYGDFGCPTCQAWYRSHTLEQVLAKYPNKVHFVWRDFPIITSDSPKAAEAGQCALDQGKFWPFHDTVYDNAPAISVDDLKSYAARVGLGVKTFDQCLDSGQDAAKVNQSLQDAYARGFRGTPSFLLNGQPIAGPPSFAYLVSLIDPILVGK